MRKLLGAAAVALLLAGCGDDQVSVGRAELEKQVGSSLQKQVGKAPDDVDCPTRLPGKVGATTRCTLTDGATQLGVTVTVTSVDGDDVGFDVAVDRS